jgi:hypothetical protein
MASPCFLHDRHHRHTSSQRCTGLRCNTSFQHRLHMGRGSLRRGSFRRNSFRRSCTRALWCRRSLWSCRFPVGHLHTFPHQPSASIIPPFYRSLFAGIRARLQSGAIRHVDLFKNLVQSTFIRHCRNAHVMLPMSIAPPTTFSVANSTLMRKWSFVSSGSLAIGNFSIGTFIFETC